MLHFDAQKIICIAVENIVRKGEIACNKHKIACKQVYNELIVALSATNATKTSLT